MDFLKKAKKNEIIAFTALVCGIVALAYIFFFLAPAFSKIASISRKISKLRSDLVIAELAVAGMPAMEKEIAELEAQATAYSNKLPREEELPALLENLSTIAQETGIKITKIVPIKDTEAALLEQAPFFRVYQEKGILIYAQCGYHQLGTFISALENAERFMEISDITIEAVKASPRQHNVQLMVKTFVAKDEN